MKTIEDMEAMGLTPADVWPSATLVVTFTDGAVQRFPDVRFLAHLDFSDPVKVNGTTVEVENDDHPITILGVRFFEWDFTN